MNDNFQSNYTEHSNIFCYTNEYTRTMNFTKVKLMFLYYVIG